MFFLKAHRVFFGKMIERVGLENVDYHRKLNSIKNYYNSFYDQILTFLRTQASIDFKDVDEVLKTALVFNSNNTKDLAIKLAK